LLRKAEGRNYPACVDLWWADMESLGLTQLSGKDVDHQHQVARNIETLGLAILHSHTAKGKPRDRCFEDAHPSANKAGVDRHTLASREAKHLLDLGRSRKVAAIQAEIAATLAGDMPPVEENAIMNTVYRDWVHDMISAYHNGGRTALERFVKSVLLRQRNKVTNRGNDKAGSPWPREFFKRVAYEAKVAFHTCYANAWVHLTPWLQTNRNLDVASEQLLRLWHHQQPRDDGRDVFWGQVIALHPISAWLMRITHHRAALSGYLNSVSMCKPGADIDNVDNPAYWDLVGSILVACHEYAEQLGIERSRRQGASIVEPNTPIDGAEDVTQPIEDMLDEHLKRQCLCCTECRHDELTIVRHAFTNEQKDALLVECCCVKCKAHRHVPIKAEDLVGGHPA
jgi:hypothetical protein